LQPASTQLALNIIGGFARAERVGPDRLGCGRPCEAGNGAAGEQTAGLPKFAGRGSHRPHRAGRTRTRRIVEIVEIVE
jgi:hypothetical protein